MINNSKGESRERERGGNEKEGKKILKIRNDNKKEREKEGRMKQGTRKGK